MKKFYTILLMLILLFPSGAFADSNVTTSQNFMTQRNKELTEYLIANASPETDIQLHIEAFFAEHPQNFNYITKNTLEKAKKLNTEVIYSNNSNDDSQSSQMTITFYDDGSFMIGQSSHRTLSEQELSELLQEKGLTTDSLEALSEEKERNISSELKLDNNISEKPASDWQSRSKNNIHQYYDNQGVFKWRTFLNATFTFNGTNCQAIDWRDNYRLGTNVAPVSPGWIVPDNMTYYYFSTVKRTQSFREYPGGYLVGEDDLRISCNQNGQFFLN